MDSEAAEVNSVSLVHIPKETTPTLIDWIESGSFQFKKMNVRPWGTYELSVSADNGSTWAGFQRPFGYGFTEKQAFEILLTESVQSDILRPQLLNWIGEEQTNTITQILSRSVAST